MKIKTKLTKEELIELLAEREFNLYEEKKFAVEPEEEQVVFERLNEVNWLLHLIEYYGKEKYTTDYVNEMLKERKERQNND